MIHEPTTHTLVIQTWHWIAFGLILATLEMFVPTFFLLWFGIAAILVGIIGYFWAMSLAMGIVIWAVLSLLLCGLWFQFINPHIKMRTKAGLGTASIIGETGMIVIAPQPNQAGIIRFYTPKAGASEWACRSQEALPLHIGEKVVVLQVLGNELLVGRLTR